MAARSKLLWVSETPAPPNVREAVGEKWELTPFRPEKSLAQQLSEARLAAIYPDGEAGNLRWLKAMLRELDRTPAVALFLLDANIKSAWAALSRCKGRVLCVRCDAPAAELSAKFTAAAALQPAISNLCTELAVARNNASRYPAEAASLDEEMQMAGRLQRDFLPSKLPEIGPVRFAVLYRPAGWVSGDIYDVIRLDETHIGFYVADAVGHGMPAALLTMFIKKALQTKRISGNSYEIVPPHVSLAELNADICQQNLSSCHFCTVVYGVIDTVSLILTYARAGHPEPIIIRDGGQVEKLSAPGSLLGIFPEERYNSETVQLEAGDRLLLYTDGIEAAFEELRNTQPLLMEDAFVPFTSMSRDQMLRELGKKIDSRPANSPHDDDVTCLCIDVEKQ